MTQQNIPDKLKHISNSPKIFALCQEIGNKFGLHIDQIGELDTQIREILRGQAESSTIIDDIMKYLEVDQELANKIANEINTKVFQTIKTEMESTSTDDAGTSSLELAGEFEIVKNNEYEPGPPTNKILSTKSQTKTEITVDNSHTDIIADHLINSPVAMPQEKIMRKDTNAETTIEQPKMVVKKGNIPENLPTEDHTEVTTNKNIPPTKPAYGSTDPYREPVK